MEKAADARGVGGLAWAAGKVLMRLACAESWLALLRKATRPVDRG